MILATLGTLLGFARRRWRSEIKLLLVWAAVIYVVFSIIEAKSPRYVLLLGPPVVILCVIALCSVSESLSRRWSESHGQQRIVRRSMTLALIVLLLFVQIAVGFNHPVPSIRGVKQVVELAEKLVPEGAIFIDGYRTHGVFTFYILAGDPDFRRRVVVGSKLLYAYAVKKRARLREFVTSPQEVLDALRTRSGARVVVVECGPASRTLNAEKFLRVAVEGPEFELVESFPVRGRGVEGLDLYRVLMPIEEPGVVELPFPILGKDVRYVVKPIQR